MMVNARLRRAIWQDARKIAMQNNASSRTSNRPPSNFSSWVGCNTLHCPARLITERDFFRMNGVVSAHYPTNGSRLWRAVDYIKSIEANKPREQTWNTKTQKYSAPLQMAVDQRLSIQRLGLLMAIPRLNTLWKVAHQAF